MRAALPLKARVWGEGRGRSFGPRAAALPPPDSGPARGGGGPPAARRGRGPVGHPLGGDVNAACAGPGTCGGVPAGDRVAPPPRPSPRGDGGPPPASRGVAGLGVSHRIERGGHMTPLTMTTVAALFFRARSRWTMRGRRCASGPAGGGLGQSRSKEGALLRENSMVAVCAQAHRGAPLQSPGRTSMLLARPSPARRDGRPPPPSSCGNRAAEGSANGLPLRAQFKYIACHLTPSFPPRHGRCRRLTARIRAAVC